MSLLGEIYYNIKNEILRKKAQANIKNIINEFINYNSNTQDKEIQEIIGFYKNKHLSPFPYRFTTKYLYRKIEVFFDNKVELPYLFHNKNKLYFPNEYNTKKIIRLYNDLCIEQDPNSPHKYTNNNFYLEKEDIIFDIGCAEGIFTLDNIDKVSKAFLFETCDKWWKPLNETFKPWKDKVTIVKKAVSDIEKKNSLTIDSFMSKWRFSNNNLFLKIDVEGHEINVLNGALKTIKSFTKKVKIAIATYHKHDDYKTINEYLIDKNYITNPTPGYILFYYDSNISAPYLRKCLIQAVSEQK